MGPGPPVPTFCPVETGCPPGRRHRPGCGPDDAHHQVRYQARELQAVAAAKTRLSHPLTAEQKNRIPSRFNRPRAESQSAQAAYRIAKKPACMYETRKLSRLESRSRGSESEMSVTRERKDSRRRLDRGDSALRAAFP